MAEEAFMTPREVADWLKVSTATLRRWVQDGEIPHVRVSRRVVRFKRSEVQATFLLPIAQRRKKAAVKAVRDAIDGRDPVEATDA